MEVRIPARAAPDVAPTIPTNRASQDANISREQSKSMSSSELKEAALAKEKQEKVELEVRIAPLFTFWSSSLTSNRLDTIMTSTSSIPQERSAGLSHGSRRRPHQKKFTCSRTQFLMIVACSLNGTSCPWKTGGLMMIASKAILTQRCRASL